MQEIERLQPQSIFPMPSAWIFASVFLALMFIGAVVIGRAPIAGSIVTIFAFAAIHNFMEFRYFAARMPVRWGRSKTYYWVGIGGVVVLALIYTVIYSSTGWLWSMRTTAYASAGWNSLFVLWVGLLFYLRGRQKPKTDWAIAFPIAMLVMAFIWRFPAYWSLALVYVHPFIAMWFLERQIRRTKPEWLRAYHICLATIPVFVIGLYLALASRPALPTDTPLLWRISQHAGSEIIPGLSSHFLVTTHVFLETIHYSVWVILIPIIDPRAIPWRTSTIPLAANRNGIPKIISVLIIASFIMVIAFWVGFSVDYSVTREIYFGLAMAHVVAEFPFLVKML